MVVVVLLVLVVRCGRELEVVGVLCLGAIVQNGKELGTGCSR